MRMRDVDIYWGERGVHVQMATRRLGYVTKQAGDNIGYGHCSGLVYEHWKNATLEDLLFIFFGIVRDGHDIEDVHKQFMKIDEYKDWYESAHDFSAPRARKLHKQLLGGKGE